MTDQSITPPPELVQQWMSEFYGTVVAPGEATTDIATRAAQWGADQELEAIQKEIITQAWFADPRHRLAQLRAARRPKPPSAVAQAEALIERHEDGWCPSPAQWHVIREGLTEGRRALEQLDD